MKILQGDSLKVLKTIPDESVDCIITSPPYYGLRDYGVSGQIGAEETMDEYFDSLLAITAELKRVLKPSGTLWWNHGDSYAGNRSGPSGETSKLNGGKRTQNHVANLATGQRRRGGTLPTKSLTLQAYRIALRMCDEQGWILRNQIIWYKPNVMPSSAKDRFTVDFEPVFFFVKNERYHFEPQYEPQYEPLSPVSIERVKYGWKSKKANASAKGSTIGIDVSEMGARFANPRGRNKRTVWKIATSNSRELKHIAMFPEKLIEPMILSGCPRGGGCTRSFLRKWNNARGRRQTREGRDRYRNKSGRRSHISRQSAQGNKRTGEHGVSPVRPRRSVANHICVPFTPL